ncbi:MAG: DUF4956 domain-containing protein [Bacteroidetes bacterium]|nr:DUF4956 domain-containing protein [Bacteroidota bacterium]
MLLQIAGEDLATPDASIAIQELATKFGVRLLIDLLTVFVLIRFIYYPINKHRELFFTYVVFNIIIFLMCFFLNRVKLSMGAAFGLFAVFGMLRYRTEDLSIKDMTYLFLVIAIGLITAVTKLEDIAYYYEFIFIAGINAFVLFLTYLLESNLLMKKEIAKTITYENIELIKPEKRAELIADIESRTGLKLNRITVAKIDFLKDTAQIKIYYYED